MAQHFSVVQKSANLREKESPGGNEVRRQAQLMQKHIQDYKSKKSVKDSQDFLFQYIVLPWIQMICKSRTLEGDYAIVGILNNQSCMWLKLHSWTHVRDTVSIDILFVAYLLASEKSPSMVEIETLVRKLLQLHWATVMNSSIWQSGSSPA